MELPGRLKEKVGEFAVGITSWAEVASALAAIARVRAKPSPSTKRLTLMSDPVSLPRQEAYYVPTVHAFRRRGGSATIDELEEDVAAAMNLSDDSARCCTGTVREPRLATA
jgi:hypothetical protein